MTVVCGVKSEAEIFVDFWFFGPATAENSFTELRPHTSPPMSFNQTLNCHLAISILPGLSQTSWPSYYLISITTMPDRQSGSSTVSAGDEEAIEYLQSLTLIERQGLARLNNQRNDTYESAFDTDDDVEEYLQDLIRDIRGGPLTGMGLALVRTFRDVLRRFGDSNSTSGQSDPSKPDATTTNTHGKR